MSKFRWSRLFHLKRGFEDTFVNMDAALLILILVDRLDFSVEHDVERVLIHRSGSVVIPE